MRCMRYLPTGLTVLRLALVPVLWWAVSSSYWVIALSVFVAAMVSDVLDGLLARRLNCVTSFGAAFDPFVDKVFMLAMYALMFFVPTMLPIPYWFFLLMGIKEVLLSLGALYFGIIKKEVVVSAAVPGKIGGFVQGVFVLYWFLGVVLGRQVFVWFGLARGLWVLMWGVRVFYLLMGMTLLTNLAAFLFYLFTFFSRRTLNR